jgi:hypothetical protein
MRTLLRGFVLVTAVIAVGVGVGPGPVAADLIGPSPSPTTPYRQFSDSPFFSMSFVPGTFRLETFETQAAGSPPVIPGVIVSPATVLGPSPDTDSVDADDGHIDGSGTAGHSLFSLSGATGITFTFDRAVLGTLPTAAGIVWTDGNNNIHFEAFDQNGTSLGTLTGSHADNSFSGTTGEDRFYGATNPGGISSIHISNDSGGIEVDHLQFGILAPAPNGGGVPEPGTLVLVGIGALTLAYRRRP